MKLTDYKLVAVRWDDAGSNESWVSLQSVMDDKDQECLSVGWLVNETPYRLVLVASRTVNDASGSEDVSGHLTVPRAMVRSITELRPFKARPKKELIVTE